MSLIIPAYVENIIGILEKNNFEGYIVGGSIRDLLLGFIPNDFDITTNAKPEEILEIFQDYKTLSVGKAFGTIRVMQKEGEVEVTTYREEGEYLDGRRPSEVRFSKELLDDLKRRDFTINALAYNKKKGIIDHFNGLEDLKNNLVRAVGNPEERFKEDHLRIIRGVRLAAQLNFTIEEKTYQAGRKMGNLLGKISIERIRDEFFKILLSDNPSYGIELLKELCLIKVILPEFTHTIGFEQHNPHHDKCVFYHSVCAMDNCSPTLELRLAALFHDIGKPKSFTIDEEGIGHFYGHDKVGVDLVRKVLNRLKCPNELIKSVTILVGQHMTAYNDYSYKGLKRLVNKVGKDRIFQLLELQKADKICSAGDKNIDNLLEREEKVRLILASDEAIEKKQLAINGHDLIKIGFPQGKIIGDLLDYLIDQVIDQPTLNTKESLLDLAKEKSLKNHKDKE